MSGNIKYRLFAFIEDHDFHVSLIVVYFLFSLYIAGATKALGVISTSYYVIVKHFVDFALLFLLFFVLYTFLANIGQGFSCFKLLLRKFRQIFSVNNICNMVFVISFLPLFMSSYVIFKIFINQIVSFRYDYIFYELDKFMHFGKSPWQILHPYLSSVQITKAIDVIYGFGWFTSWYLIFILLCINDDRELRYIFYSTFLLSWIVLGSCFNYLFPSAGPCYVDKIAYFENSYNDLISYLIYVDSQTKLNAFVAQNSLWTAYSESVFSFGCGISAMPSMHLSMMTTTTLGALRINKIYGSASAIMAFIIFIGSIHLGWHYAVDAYFSIIVTIIIWFIMTKNSNIRFKKSC